MIHQFRDKKRIKKRRLFFKTIAICCIFFVLSVTGFFSWTGKMFTSMGRVIWKTESKVSESLSSVGYIARTKASVFAENEKIKKEDNELKLSMIDYQILKKENEQLKELLGRIPAKSDFILANIITRPNNSPYDTIIIDSGIDVGIKEGVRVYANANIPIGEVSKVYKNASLVRLYSNPGQVTGAVLDGSNASVDLIGRGGGNFEMTVPLELVTDNGVAVVLPGLNTEVLAIVDAVISSPTDPQKKVILHSPANIQSLKWVQVKKD